MTTKQVTRIKRAFKQYAQAYREYHRTCKQMDITIKSPLVLHVSGLGWQINGKLTRATADEIVSNLEAHTRDCLAQMKAECGELTLEPANAVPMIDQRPSETWYANIRPPLEPIEMSSNSGEELTQE